ncbi:unnamed protein product, partial [Mesorhabditis belari]|uniref:Tyrosine-protein kinase n=1 Tax=Mesorhabditis belari TaxID=2138241 RepID=A0AAF3FGB9_9BILA
MSEKKIPPWLSSHPAFHGFLPREDATTVLNKEGSYLIRVSQVVQDGTTRLCFVISYRLTEKQVNDARAAAPASKCPTSEMAIRHIAVVENKGSFTINEKHDFASLKELIDYHSSKEEQIPGAGFSYKCKLQFPIARQEWELLHENLKTQETLGEGQFGVVYRGSLRRPSTKWVSIALKQTKDDCAASKKKRKEIMAECRLMRGLNHLNVVRFYGVAVLRQPIYIVLELVPGLDLLLYLTNNRGKINKRQRHAFVSGIAFGIEYIHSQGIIHRDLAARNCLVDSVRNLVKISDFGMSIRGSEYELPKAKNAVRLPLRWMAPECILEFRYTQKTDVWSFGLIVYEIYTEGRQPYEGKKNDQVRELLMTGVKPQLPKGAGKKLQDFLDNSVFTRIDKRASMMEISNFIVQWSGIQRPPALDEDSDGTPTLISSGTDS